jgi:glycosyltransferase involved in cell wall biosynthesis
VNIAFVAHYYDQRDGTGGYVFELLTRVAGRHEVTLYAVAARSPLPDGVRFVGVPALRGSAYATILSFPAAFAAVRGRHEVVHAQGWVTGRADVVTAHIVLAAWREAAGRAAVRTPPGERLLGGFVQRREAHLFQSGARAAIAPSEKARRELAAHYGRREGVHVIPHGFPAPSAPADRAAARRHLGLDPDAFVALYAGDPRKGLPPAIEALRDAPGTTLLVASRSGLGPYRAAADALGVASRVRWAPAQTPIAAAYAAADVLVHPTIYDTFALVVAEAMAAGLPVVVSREAGIAELIEHGRSGWLLSAPTGAELSAALNTLHADVAARAALGAAGQAVAATRTWDVVAEETLRVFEQVAGR